MGRRLNVIFQWLFLSILSASLIVACGKQEKRQRPTGAGAGQKTTGDKGGGQNGHLPGQPAETSDAEKERLAREEKERRAKAELEHQERARQIDLEDTTENHGASQLKAWENNAAIVQQIVAVSMSKKEENGKLNLEFSLFSKPNTIAKGVAVKMIYKTEVAKTVEELKSYIELHPFTNTQGVDLSAAAAEAKKMFGTVDVRLRISKKDNKEIREFVVRVTKNDKEALALTFEPVENSDTLKLVQVLGDKKDLIKTIGVDADIEARAQKLEELVETNKVFLAEAGKYIRELGLHDLLSVQADYIESHLISGKLSAKIKDLRDFGKKYDHALSVADGSAEKVKSEAKTNEGIIIKTIYDIQAAVQDQIGMLQRLIDTEAEYRNDAAKAEKVKILINKLSSVTFPFNPDPEAKLGYAATKESKPLVVPASQINPQRLE